MRKELEKVLKYLINYQKMLNKKMDDTIKKSGFLALELGSFKREIIKPFEDIYDGLYKLNMISKHMSLFIEGKIIGGLFCLKCTEWKEKEQEVGKQDE